MKRVSMAFVLLSALQGNKKPGAFAPGKKGRMKKEISQ